jgi:hypothetical protein
VKLGENHRARLIRVQQGFDKNVTIVTASLIVNGNNTKLSVTLKNEGDYAFRIFGLTLNGEFNASRTWMKTTWERFHMGRMHDWQGMFENFFERIHPSTIPFKVNETSLVPLFGTYLDRCFGYERDSPLLSSLTLQPGETATLTFDGVIALQTGFNSSDYPAMVIIPNDGLTYTLRLMGQGFQTYSVEATAMP